MRRRPIVAVAVLTPALAVLALLAYGFSREPKDIPSPLLGRPAPSFSLMLFGGRRVRVEDFRGKVVFLNFWASWCPPCRAEAPMLEAMWRELKDQNVVFLGVNTQDEEAKARPSSTSSASAIRTGATRAAVSRSTTGCGDCRRPSSSTRRAASRTSISER